MPDAVADVLVGLEGQPERLEDLRGMLDDPTRRTEFEGYLEDLARYDFMHGPTKVHSRYHFFAGVLEREGKRLKGHGQLEAIKTLDESLPSILGALDTAINRSDAELLVTFAKHLVKYLDLVGRLEEALEKVRGKETREGH